MFNEVGYNIKALQILKARFIKVCINRYIAKDVKRNHYYRYRRDDLSQWSKEAFEKGEDYFYAEPVDINNPNGKLHLCKPKYVYRFIGELSEEEFNAIFEGIK